MIHASEYRDMHPRIFPICEAMHATCYVAMRTHKRDDHYPIFSKLYYGYLVALCGPYIATLPTPMQLCRVTQADQNWESRVY